MRSLLVAIVLVLGSCDDPEIPLGNDELFLKFATGQVTAANVGQTLPPVRFRVTTVSGSPVLNVPISWALIGPLHCAPGCSPAGSSVSPSQTTTDANGEVTLTVRVGSMAGIYRLLPTSTRTLSDADTIDFSALEPASSRR